MMEEYQSYIITSLDTHTLDFDELKYMRANITAMRLIDPTSFDITNGSMSRLSSFISWKKMFFFRLYQQFMIGFKGNVEINEFFTSLPNMF